MCSCVWKLLCGKNRLDMTFVIPIKRMHQESTSKILQVSFASGVAAENLGRCISCQMLMMANQIKSNCAMMYTMPWVAIHTHTLLSEALELAFLRTASNLRGGEQRIRQSVVNKCDCLLFERCWQGFAVSSTIFFVYP